MKFFQNIKNSSSIVGELLSFVWKRRTWMIPLIVILLLCGIAIAVLAAVAPVAPFIYTLF